MQIAGTLMVWLMPMRMAAKGKQSSEKRYEEMSEDRERK